MPLVLNAFYEVGPLLIKSIFTLAAAVPVSRFDRHWNARLAEKSPPCPSPQRSDGVLAEETKQLRFTL